MKLILCNECGATSDYVAHIAKVEDGKTVLYHQRHFPQVKRRLECPHCSSVDVESYIEVSEVQVSFNRFSSLSNEQKRTLLKKRSQEHAKKHIRPYKNYINHG